MNDVALNHHDPTDAPTHRSDQVHSIENQVHSIENGTAALTDLVGAAMFRSIARRLGRTVAPPAHGGPIRGLLAITVGIAAISFPAVTLPTMLVILGGYLLVDGVLCLLGLRGARVHRWRLAIPGVLGICVAGLVFTLPELSQTGLVMLLSLWVIAMGAFRLRDAVAFDGGIRANWVLVFLSMLAIIAGCEGLLAPDEAVLGVLINVWIFPILNGMTLITTAARAHPAG